MSVQVNLEGKFLEVIGCEFSIKISEKERVKRKEFCTNCYYAHPRDCRRYRKNHECNYLYRLAGT